MVAGNAAVFAAELWPILRRTNGFASQQHQKQTRQSRLHLGKQFAGQV
jgi:hypothetical protein